MLLAGQVLLIAFVTTAVNIFTIVSTELQSEPRRLWIFCNPNKNGDLRLLSLLVCNQFTFVSYFFYVHSKRFFCLFGCPLPFTEAYFPSSTCREKPHRVSSEFMAWVWQPGLDKELGFSPVVIDFTQQQTKMVFCRQKTDANT